MLVVWDETWRSKLTSLQILCVSVCLCVFSRGAMKTLWSITQKLFKKNNYSVLTVIGCSLYSYDVQGKRKSEEEKSSVTLILFQQLTNICVSLLFFPAKDWSVHQVFFIVIMKQYSSNAVTEFYPYLGCSVSANVILCSCLTQFYAVSRSIIGLAPSKSDLEIFIKCSVVSVIVNVACLLSPRF